jgi:hypothetical protein
MEYRLGNLHAMKGVSVVVVYHSAVLILQVIKLFSYTSIFCKQLYLIVTGFKIVGYANPDNNLESSNLVKLI